eukprot:353304-Amphidinium_carterae.1
MGDVRPGWCSMHPAVASSSALELRLVEMYDLHLKRFSCNQNPPTKLHSVSFLSSCWSVSYTHLRAHETEADL